MAYRAWAICAAVAILASGSARGEPPKELPSTLDSFRDTIFNPPGSPGARVAPVSPPVPAEPSPFADSIFQPTGATQPAGCLPQRAVDACACAPDFTTWLTAEWVIGRTSGPSVVPVATTGPAAAGPSAGAVGQPGTVPLFGGRRVLNDWRSGLRVEAGIWLDRQHETGIDARFYSLFSADERFAARPGGAALVNVPQFVPIGPVTLQLPVFVGFPGVTAGSVDVSAKTIFYGGDVNLRRLFDGDGHRLEWLVGYRQLYLSDSLDANFAVVPVGVNPLLAPRLMGADSVHTRNNFYGPQIGVCGSTGGDRLTVETHGAVALGATVSNLDFFHSRTAGAPATATQFPVIQTRANDSLTYFGVVAEGGIRLNLRATDHLRLAAGYSVLYWNNVRRAQEMFASGPVLRPQAIDFTLHLFSVGLDVRY